MANPNNAIGTNAAFGGRTSPNAFNDVLGAFQSRGILSGWACSPDSGMSVVLGGDGINRDVAIAEDNAGNKTTVNNISGSPISVTIGAAPASQSRIDAIVVYIENPPQGTATATDNYGTIGVLDVQGNTASTPVAPNESAIRTAITADGASGATAYYVVLAYVTVATGTTDITSEMITAGDAAILQSELTNIPANTITASMIQNGAVTSYKIDWSTFQPSTTERVVGTWTDGRPVYEQAFAGTVGTITANTLSQTVLLAGVSEVVGVSGYFSWTSTHSVPVGEATFLRLSDSASIFTCVVANNSNLELRCFNSTSSYTDRPYSIVVRYLKSGQ